MTTVARPKIASHLHPEPSWNAADHQRPTGREEVWRFTPLKRAEPLFEPDGISASGLAKLDLPEGSSSKVISRQEAQDMSLDGPVDLVSFNASQAEDALLVTVDKNAELDRPLNIELHGEGQSVNGHLIIEIGANAIATIVLRHTGTGVLNSKVEIHVADGANINFVCVQDWDPDATQGGQISTQIGTDAQVRLIQASIGGSFIRQVERVSYAGTGGALEQFGLYFVDAGEHIEHRIMIDHNQPNTSSYADYRGALQGKGAHSVWIGDVLIQSNAKGIDTYETNRNLVLSEGCQADSVPNLEIETGQIERAGHSSSTGRFDEEQLYYLMSRGIPEDQARRLIVEGFFVDLIRKIHVPEIQQRLLEALNHELSLVEGLSHETIMSQEDL